MSRTRSLAQSLARPAAPGLGGILTAVLQAGSTWVTRRHERAMLARLDAHLLRDIGLDPQVVAEECRKPAWRA